MLVHSGRTLPGPANGAPLPFHSRMRLGPSQRQCVSSPARLTFSRTRAEAPTSMHGEVTREPPSASPSLNRTSPHTVTSPRHEDGEAQENRALMHRCDTSIIDRVVKRSVSLENRSRIEAALDLRTLNTNRSPTHPGDAASV